MLSYCMDKQTIDRKFGEVKSQFDFEIDDIIAEIAPVYNGKDPFWEQSAREVLRTAVNAILISGKHGAVSIAKLKDIINVAKLRLDEVK